MCVHIPFPLKSKGLYMESNLKTIKDVLDEVILAEKGCCETMSSLLLKENERFQSPILAKIAKALNELPNVPPSVILKDLEGENGQHNLG